MLSTHISCIMFPFDFYCGHYNFFNFWCLPLLPARQFGYVWIKSGSSEREVLHFFFGVTIILCALPIWLFLAFLILKTIITMVALKIYPDIVGTKGNDAAAAVLFDVDYFTKA